MRCMINLLGMKTPETYPNRGQNVVISVGKKNVAFELLQFPKGNSGVLESKHHIQTVFGGVLKAPNEQEQHQCRILTSGASMRWRVCISWQIEIYICRSRTGTFTCPNSCPRVLLVGFYTNIVPWAAVVASSDLHLVSLSIMLLAFLRFLSTFCV